MKAAIIGGIFAIAAAVTGSIVSWRLGKEDGVTEMRNYMSDTLAPVFGDNNTVTINDLGTFVGDYENVKNENEQIKNLNENYISQLA